MRNALREIWQLWRVAWLLPFNPHKNEPAATLSLDWAAVRDGAPSHFSSQVRVACSDPFFECQGHYVHWHSSSVMRSLWATVYGHQKCAKVGQRVHVWTYRCSWRTAFWSAFGFGRKIPKVEKEQEMLEDRHVTVHNLCEWSLKSERVQLATWQESSMTRVYRSVQEKVFNFSKNKTKNCDLYMDYYWSMNIEFYVPDKKISSKC